MDVTSEVPPAAPLPISALQTVRRNASIKRLLKLGNWGSGKLIHATELLHFHRHFYLLCMCVFISSNRNNDQRFIISFR